MPRSKRKILFFAEGATLAHVGRPFVLAETLDPAEFEVVFARPPAFSWLTREAGFRVVDLYCQDSAVFARRLDWGQPLYDFDTLARYVRDDLALIEAERPDVIVGDFRLSLSVSARLAGIPYLTVCDAYWSPERPLRLPLPVFKWTPFVPLTMAQWLFAKIAPLALRQHTAPLEQLRARHGLPPLGHDLRLCYTDADVRLFANFPQLYPEIPPTGTAVFLGPVAWSPKGALPEGLEHAANLIYITMGSSGDPAILAKVLPALEDTGLEVVVATAGKPIPIGSRSPRTRIFDYLPGNQMCQRASLVICNGGSPTTNQALAQGVPVLGLTRNMDQFLNMETILRFGAGLALRSDTGASSVIRSAISKFQTDPSLRGAAQRLSDQHSSAEDLCRVLRQILR